MDMEGIDEEGEEGKKKGASRKFKRRKSIEEESNGSDDESSRDNEDDTDKFGSILGEEYAPRSDCTGNPYPVRCHLLRSLGRWSGGLLETEKGIQNAYKHFIESAQHYIYIENQFFVSGMRGNGRVTNTLAQCLYARIVKAAMSKSKFKVLVLIPLLPAMEGPVSGGALSSIAGVMYWQYRSICSGGNSLLENLAKAGVDWKQHIHFIGLRTHEKMSNGWQTEMVYIHSKLMIVDDRVSIIGSANMNDRSMLGNKDSEVCILTEDTKMVDSVMDSSSYKAGKFNKSLRMKCWSEFCGLDAEDEKELKPINDPCSDECWDFLGKLAAGNTSKYEQVFKDLVPSNRIRKGEDLHGTGLSSGAIKDHEFKKRMSVSTTVDDDGNSSQLQLAEIGGNLSSEDVERLKLLAKGGGGAGAGSFRAQDASHSAKKAIGLLNSIQGLMVEWPLDFMCEDFKNLHPTALPGEIFK